MQPCRQSIVRHHAAGDEEADHQADEDDEGDAHPAEEESHGL